ncbi:hypothetical protein OKW22_000814 [Bacilli bacterium PM5-3]|nr:hypothetical protein [Bacilli bacterium PM5-3]MDH6603650.1 hypothetical protein [Bacilli bacterium PM5-9]
MKKIGVKLLIVIVILGAIYGAGVLYFNNNVIFNATIYNEKVESYNSETIQKILDNQNIKLLVKDKREEIEDPLNTLEYTIINENKLKEEIINQQNTFMWPILIISGSNYEPAKLDVNEKSLKNWIKENKIIDNKNLLESKDASFNISDGKVTVKKEVIGEQLDSKLVEKEIANSLKNGNLEVDLSKAIIMPNVLSSVLEETIEEVEYKIANQIELEVEGKDYVIKPTTEDKLKWITVDYKKNNIVVEKKAIKSYLASINQDFIKKGGSIETVYKVSNGNSKLVSQGKAVSGVDEYALTAKIYDAMENNYELVESIKAISISKPKVVYQGHTSIDNNFVEVSISNQQVYLYTDGKLVLTADVVTGKPGGDTDTPKGKFSIMYKTTHFTLKGDAYGYDYALPVDYWLPFEGGGGVGLHDAPWRANSSFGGSLYLSDGSHGCINMRLADVRKIYNTVVAGTGVWVH